MRGWGNPNSDDWRKSLALCLLCGHRNRRIHTAYGFSKMLKQKELESFLQWRRDSFLCFTIFPTRSNTGKKSNKEGKCSRPFPQSSGGRGGGIGPGIRGISYAHSKMAPMVSPPAAVGRTNDSQRRKQMSPTLSLKSLPHL